ncbi:MAG: chromosomal replication initiator protein DnaA [Coriobacteriia bacterium]|nr:chromosomal replication initiator protein DnaA [Coriobacteriia bacterium]
MADVATVAAPTYTFIDDGVIDKDILWHDLCELLEEELQEEGISTARMSSTFSSAVPLGITDEGQFIIGVPNAFNHSVITNMHLSDMNKLINRVSEYDGLTCTVVLDPDLVPTIALEPAPAPTVVEIVGEEKKHDSTTSNKFEPKFTFDSFIVGESNELAYSASLAVAESPGLKYNPLFIWGGPGLGKTHLLQAIGSYVEQCYPNKKITYTTMEEVMNKYIDAVTVKTVDINWLRTEYRTTDVLIIDDIQILVGKKETADFFFHTFNSLKQQRKQIVIASDRSPDQLDLEERMTSRFKSGMLADIQLPSYEVRLAILKQYIKTLNIEFLPEALEYIAERSSGNIREMEGVGTRVSALAELRHKDTVDLEFVEHATAGLFLDPANRPVSVETIIGESAKYYNLQKSDLVGVNRKQDIVHARHVAMYLCQEMTDSSYPAIGRAFGGKDHTSVLHAVNKIRKKMSEERDLFNQIQMLTNQIKKRVI